MLRDGSRKMDEETLNTLLKLYFDDDMSISLRQKAVHNAILFSEELQRLGYAKRISKWGLRLTENGVEKMKELGIDHDKLKEERIMKEYERIKKKQGEEQAKKFLEFMRSTE